MTTYVTRAQWGARAAKPGGNQFGQILGTAVHWEAAPPPVAHSGCAEAVRKVQAFHMNPPPHGRGWNDIAYNAIACDHNYLFEGRQGGTAANGTDYGNLHFPAVCWLGGPGHTPTDDALRAIVTARGRLGGLSRPIYPHNHFYATACPGVVLTTWVKNGAHPPGVPKPPPPSHDPNFQAQFVGTGGNPNKKNLHLNEIEPFFADYVIPHHKADPPGVPYTVVVQFYSDKAPPES